jgi:acetyltransferase-like isoleucine patch superfamily enzyme
MNLWGKVQTGASVVRGRLAGHGDIRLEPGVKLRIGNGQLRTAGRVTIGRDTLVGVNGAETRATFHIGAGTRIGAQSVINVASGLSIGQACELSWRVQILDTDFHTLTHEDGRQTIPAKPIKIGNHVLIGTGVIILKGVTIGDGAVIGAGAVVSRDVPANSIAVGNPAQIVGSIVGWN